MQCSHQKNSTLIQRLPQGQRLNAALTVSSCCPVMNELIISLDTAFEFNLGMHLH